MEPEAGKSGVDSVLGLTGISPTASSRGDIEVLGLRGSTGCVSASRDKLEAASDIDVVREKPRTPDMENLPPEAPCLAVGEAGVMDGVP